MAWSRGRSLNTSCSAALGAWGTVVSYFPLLMARMTALCCSSMRAWMSWSGAVGPVNRVVVAAPAAVQDLAPQVDQRLDPGIGQSLVLGLDMEDPVAVADVAVVAGDHGASCRRTRSASSGMTSQAISRSAWSPSRATTALASWSIRTGLARSAGQGIRLGRGRGGGRWRRRRLQVRDRAGVQQVREREAVREGRSGRRRQAGEGGRRRFQAHQAVTLVGPVDRFGGTSRARVVVGQGRVQVRAQGRAAPRRSPGRHPAPGSSGRVSGKEELRQGEGFGQHRGCGRRGRRVRGRERRGRCCRGGAALPDPVPPAPAVRTPRRSRPTVPAPPRPLRGPVSPQVQVAGLHVARPYRPGLQVFGAKLQHVVVFRPGHGPRDPGQLPGFLGRFLRGRGRRPRAPASPAGA